jgi:hypothetical protein
MVDRRLPSRPVASPIENLLQSPPGDPLKDLGTTQLARLLGVDDEALYGHWCRRCQGLWWGLALEAACPSCGHRGP